MRRRPVAIYAIAVWILFASFSLIRPLMVRQIPVAQALSPREFGAILLVAFILIILLATLVVRLHRIALVVAAVICASWTLLILLRIGMAIQYSPQIFATRATGPIVYAAPAAAVAGNIAVLWYLRKLMS
jgi:hypothetical protein